jgi:HNH endonuclease
MTSKRSERSRHDEALPHEIEHDSSAFVEELEVPTGGTVYRLHSANHFVSCSSGKYEHLSRLQRTAPVRLMAKSKWSWWWYRDRFWWADRGLGAGELASTIVTMDVASHDQREASERAQADLFHHNGDASPEFVLPEHIRREVWIRNDGRCVDCGATSSLAFDHVLPLTVGGSNTAPNLELRCRPCQVRRRDNEGRATVGKARIGAQAAKQWGVELKDTSWPS